MEDTVESMMEASLQVDLRGRLNPRRPFLTIHPMQSQQSLAGWTILNYRPVLKLSPLHENVKFAGAPGETAGQS
jgi:hypothetical protein